MTETDTESTRYRLLLVDDDDVMRRSAARFLGRAGFEIVSVPSGPAALDALSQHDLDVAVVDLQMPEMDGIEVLRAIDRLRPGLPAGLWTASPFVDELPAEDLALAAFVVPKMRPISELVEAVRRAVEESKSGGGSGGGGGGAAPRRSGFRRGRDWGFSTGMRRKDGKSVESGQAQADTA